MAKEAMRDMKTIAIIILIVIAALLLVFGLIYFSKYNALSKENLNQNTNCGTMPAGYIKDACYTKLAVDASDADACINVTNMDQRDLCYTGVSKVLLNKAICDNIADKFYSRPKCYAELKMMGVG